MDRRSPGAWYREEELNIDTVWLAIASCDMVGIEGEDEAILGAILI